MKKLSGYVSKTDYEFSQSLIPDNEERFRISFLGNILNSGEIAGLLRSSGHPVKNDTTGELIYRSFLNWGEDLATRLKGSFIIVIYDTQQGILLIARDHFGKIPTVFFLV